MYRKPGIPVQRTQYKQPVLPASYNFRDMEICDDDNVEGFWKHLSSLVLVPGMYPWTSGAISAIITSL